MGTNKTVYEKDTVSRKLHRKDYTWAVLTPSFFLDRAQELIEFIKNNEVHRSLKDLIIQSAKTNKQIAQRLEQRRER